MNTEIRADSQMEQEIEKSNQENIQIIQKEEENVGTKGTKVKRNPLEKIIDDSLTLMECSNQNFKQEYAELQDTNSNINYEGEIKEDLRKIKNCCENKKKTLLKKSIQESETEKVDPNPSKKKKVNDKRDNTIIDTSEIVKKIEEANLNELNENKDELECTTPIKEKKERENEINDKSEEKDDEEKDLKNGKSEINSKKNLGSFTSDKKNKIEKPKESQNMNITNFFTKRPNQQSIMNSIANSAISNKNLNRSEVRIENNIVNNNIEDISQFNNKFNELLNDQNLADKIITTELNQPEMFLIDINPKTKKTNISFNLEYLKFTVKELSKNDLKYYNLNNINNSNQFEELKEMTKIHFKESSLIYKQQNSISNNKRRKRIIFIHDSSLRNRKFSEKQSFVINPRNPFKQDDCLIDYDKDSEEEFLEENAEDIKSNENSADEEENLNEEEEEEEKWIVPDGHLSEDEVSEQEDDLFSHKNENMKCKSVMDIIEFRKGYSKAVVISFKDNLINNQLMTPKVKTLTEVFKCRIFQCNIPNENNKENLITEFPIEIISKNNFEDVSKKVGMNTNIKDRLDDVVREIHYSYMHKEYLIRLVNEKYSAIAKKALDNFFKESCLKINCNIKLRKQWLVKKEILDTLHFSASDLNLLFETQTNILNDKEKERKKELQLNEDNKANILNEHRINNIVINSQPINNSMPIHGGFNLMSMYPVENKINSNSNLFNLIEIPVNTIRSQPNIDTILNSASNNLIKNKIKKKEIGASTKTKVKKEKSKEKDKDKKNDKEIKKSDKKKSLGSTKKKSIGKKDNNIESEEFKNLTSNINIPTNTKVFDLTKMYDLTAFVNKGKQNQKK